MIQPPRTIETCCLLVGSVAVLGFGAAHGALPEDDGQAVLRFVADHPHYAGVHLGSIIGVALWAVGLTALPAALDGSTARGLARVAAITALIGAPVFVTQFAVDGYGHHALASMWQDAAPPEQASLARTVELIDTALEGPGFAWIALLWGLPLILTGLAAVLARNVAAWWGWPAMLAGCAILAAAVTRFLQATLVSDQVIFAVSTFAAALWGIVLGIIMWHRFRAAPTDINSSAEYPRP